MTKYLDFGFMLLILPKDMFLLKLDTILKANRLFSQKYHKDKSKTEERVKIQTQVKAKSINLQRFFRYYKDIFSKMHFLRQTALMRYSFSIIKDKLLKNLKATLPIRNGGAKTIERSVAKKYFDSQFQAGKKACQKKEPLIRSVSALRDSVYQNPVLRMCFQGAIDSIPANGMLAGADPEEVFHLLNITTISAPKFQNQGVTGVPYYLLFLDFLDTRYGQAFFANPIVNQHLKQIFNDYQTMLCSQVSLEYMNTKEPNGWFCPTAQQFVNYDDYYVDKTHPNWGYTNWNEWFIKKIRPERRPIDPRSNAIVNSSDSYPLQYKPGQLGSNPAYNVLGYDNFWLKDNLYSLYDMLGADKMKIKPFVDKHFVGGTVYQAFLDPFCYHRWHAPVSGTIVKSYKLGGTYFLDNPGYELGGEDSTITNFIDSQPMFSMIAVRQIFIIKMDDGSDRHVAVIEIGMSEVSSCNPTVIEGQKVKKGDQLGYFQFGGSSHAIIFDKNLKLTFNPSIKQVNSKSGSIMQKVNAWLATYQ